MNPWHDVALGDDPSDVFTDDPEHNHLRDVSELSPHRLQEVERFFLDYKLLEDKEGTIENLYGRDEARRVILESVELYEKEFKT